MQRNFEPMRKQVEAWRSARHSAWRNIFGSMVCGFHDLIRQPGCPVEVGWGDLEHNRVTRILRNPRYAGAFFYGRTRWHKKIDGGFRKQSLPRQEWHTLILDGHPAYIT
jgi:hypothetical protein